MIKIGNAALKSCNSLRNMAFPPDVVLGDAIFINEEIDIISDLHLLFGSEASIIRELQH